jgi:hypothetical protein
VVTVCERERGVARRAAAHLEAQTAKGLMIRETTRSALEAPVPCVVV